MGQDRFIAWGKKRPTKQEIAKVAKNLLGGIGKVENKKGPWLSILLPGENTHPLKGIKGTPGFINVRPDNKTTPRERWIEVFHPDPEPKDKKPLTSVITRMQDEFTGAIADQLQEVLARWWEGKLDPLGK